MRARWERIANAVRRGEPMPPISLFQIGEVYFVRDGHHRVSVARALGRTDIDAYVVEVRTRVGADRTLHVDDLPKKSHERLFHERVPLPSRARGRIGVTDAWDYGVLAGAVEAWAFRLMQDRAEFLDRASAARLWFDEEYEPVVEMLREADMLGDGTETDAYLRVSKERYRLMRTHEWSEDVLARVREDEAASRAPRPRRAALPRRGRRGAQMPLAWRRPLRGVRLGGRRRRAARRCRSRPASPGPLTVRGPALILQSRRAASTALESAEPARRASA